MTKYREFLRLHSQGISNRSIAVSLECSRNTVADTVTGNPIPVYVFVAILPCGGYSYAEGFLNQNPESWINAHVHACQFFGGAAKLLIPDNLKTGVEKAHLALTGNQQNLS
jgi:transposase